MEKTNLEWALYYRSIGWSPFPIKRADKTPLIKWEKYQTEIATEEEIRNWWQRFPDANIGIATGRVSGIVVVDVEAGGSINGLSPTVVANTGGGGYHFFYKHPGIQIKNSVRELAPLTDIRGDGGYVVVSPSLHKSGKCYEWSIAPEEASFEDLPKWILEKCTTNVEQKRDWKEFSTTSIGEGARNSTAASYAGKLLHDLSPELWESAGWTSLRNWNNLQANPPLPEKELRSVFESIGKKEIGSRIKNPSERKSPTRKGELLSTCMADVQPEPISWLWPGRIALGKLTLIAGDPGLGKSLLTATMAATISKGYTWPLQESPAQIGSVVLLSAEDDPADTIRPRLDAAEADCKRIHILHAIRDADEEGNPIQRMFSFKRDLSVLEEFLPTLPDCRLLIIDPISAYLDGTDSHKNTDVRGLLAPLAELASRNKVAIVLVQHLNKSNGGSAMYRAIGSVAFVAAARAAYIVTKDQNNPERRLVMPIKNNLAQDITGLAYSVITAGNGAPVITWESEPVTITADEALASSNIDEEKSETDWAIDFLQDFLASEPKKVSEVSKEAKEAGIKEKPLRRAREKLGVITRKSTYLGGWVWELSKVEDAQSSEDALSKRVGILGIGGHLGAAGEERNKQIQL